MTTSSPEQDDQAPDAAVPRAPRLDEPGFRIRESHVDGTVDVMADIGVSAGRLVDRLAIHTPIASVLTSAAVEGGRLLLTFTRPQR
ncbi:hypothetical protein [Parafrankia sp. BMG5.11]|uniref:hypothetical protein n=1 Tax=Parafrankia sp. BMG5.11 TaxID=222540 RepID=UPI00103FC4DB|nr:hypothetical protein [Parafrankia sp. BMG5.11]TCJ36858.1 hypothetical protein E0504_21515 [Parafrankia sp. BMG5.11]